VLLEKPIAMTDTEANVHLVQRLYDAMGREDLDGACALMSDEVTFVVPGLPGVGAAGTWRGHAGVRECFRRLRASQDNQAVEIHQFVAQGDTVVVLLHARATVRSTGKAFESGIIHFFTIREGRIERLLDFFDTAAVVEANR
jgi:uncharacterized protein